VNNTETQFNHLVSLLDENFKDLTNTMESTMAPHVVSRLQAMHWRVNQMMQMFDTQRMTALLERKGPTATILREQARIQSLSRYLKEYQNGQVTLPDYEKQTEEQILQLTPPTFTWPVDFKWQLHLKYFTTSYRLWGHDNGLRAHAIFNESLSSGDVVPSTQQYQSATVGDNRLEVSRNSFSLHFVQKHKNGCRVSFVMEPRNNHFRDIIVYDVLENTSYPGHEGHIDPHMLKKDYYKLMIASGWDEAKAAVMHEKDAHWFEAQMKKLFDENPASEDQLPDVNGLQDYYSDKKYTESLVQGENGQWTRNWSYSFTSREAGARVIILGENEKVKSISSNGEDQTDVVIEHGYFAARASNPKNYSTFISAPVLEHLFEVIKQKRKEYLNISKQ